jgi:type I restriction enzyme S subunit
VTLLHSKTWQPAKLGNIVSFKTGRLNSNAATPNGPYPFFTCSPTTLTTDSYSFDTECVLMAGNNASGVYTVKYFKGKFDAYQRTYVIRSLDDQRLLNRFLYYALRTKLEMLKSISTGAATKFLTLAILRDIEMAIPPLSTQRKIAAILSAYDDLIEKNLRRIKILEEIAQLVYHEWFVNFRFPGHEQVRMVESELGPIPEGWDAVRTEDLVKRIPSGKRYEQRTVSPVGSVPVLDQGRSGIIGYHDDEPGVRASEERPVVVFANHTCYQRIIHYPFSAIQNVLPFVANPERRSNIYWLHWATKDLVEFNDYKGHWPEFMTKRLVCPPTNYTEEFGQVVNPIMRLIYKLEIQNQILQRTRDLLLPKLISGELDVSELDIDIGEEPA